MDKKKRTLRAIIYARKSSDDRKTEDQSLSVSEQIQACQDLAKKQGYLVKGVFVDDGISGRTPPEGYESTFNDDHETQNYIVRMRKKSRPGFGQVCKQIEAGEVDILLVRDMTRVARPKFLSTLINWIPSLLKMHKVKVHSVTEGILDPNNQQQMMFSIIKDAMIDDEITRRAKLSLETKQKMKREGVYFGKGYYGVKQVGKKYSLVNDEAKTVKLIFQLRAKGKSFGDIARGLEKKNMRRGDGKYFPESQLTNIVIKPLYAGLLNLGDTENPDFIQAKNIPAIVTKEVFMKCFGQRQRNRLLYSFTPRTAGGALLSGLVKCGYCDGAMTKVISGGTKLQHRHPETLMRYCCNQNRLGLNCRCRCSILAYHIETFISEFILLKTVSQLESVKDYELKKRQLPSLLKRLDAVRKKRLALLKDESLDADFIAEAGQEFSSQINDLQKQVHEIETMPEPRTGKMSGVLEVGKMEIEERREILRQFVEGIKIYRDKMEIKFVDVDEVLTVGRIIYKKGRASKLPRIVATPRKNRINFTIEDVAGSKYRDSISGSCFDVEFASFEDEELEYTDDHPGGRKR